jgi:hypothetical protein
MSDIKLFYFTKTNKKKVLVNMAAVTHLNEADTAYGDKYTEIKFSDKDTLDVKETLDEVVKILSEEE